MRIHGCRRCYLRHGCGPLHTQRRARKAPLDSTYRNLGSREGRSPISRVLSPESRTFRNVIREPWHFRTTSNSHILYRPSYPSLLQEFENDQGLVSMDLRVLPEGKTVLTDRSSPRARCHDNGSNTSMREIDSSSAATCPCTNEYPLSSCGRLAGRGCGSPVATRATE